MAQELSLLYGKRADSCPDLYQCHTIFFLRISKDCFGCGGRGEDFLCRRHICAVEHTVNVADGFAAAYENFEIAFNGLGSDRDKVVLVGVKKLDVC